MEKKTDFMEKERLRKAARKTAMNTIAWHSVSAVAMIFLVYLFRSSTAFCIILAIAALIEIGLVALAVLSLKTRLQEIDEME